MHHLSPRDGESCETVAPGDWRERLVAHVSHQVATRGRGDACRLGPHGPERDAGVADTTSTGPQGRVHVGANRPMRSCASREVCSSIRNSHSDRCATISFLLVRLLAADLTLDEPHGQWSDENSRNDGCC